MKGSGILDRVISLLYPKRCVCCDKVIPAKNEFCGDCEVAFYRLKSGRCMRFGMSGIEIFGAFIYDGAAADAIKLLKFRDRPHNAEFLGKLLAKSVLERYEVQFDMVCAVPMTALKKAQREYNQAELFAKAVAEYAKIDYRPHVLKKVRENAVQHELLKRQRRENVAGVFWASPEVKGKTVLVIDDVATTGATLCECAKMLLKNGAQQVYCAVFAISRG